MEIRSAGSCSSGAFFVPTCHLLTALFQSKSTCSNHQAVNNASQNHSGCDATGIAAFACARSGAFIPGSVVDFQKGERQVNIDYALCEAMKAMGMDEGGKVMVIYDVMCQYHIHLWERIKQNPFLSFPQKVELLMAIGLFHVHGHQDSCLFRFATSFIPGAGMVDGEILESLWAQLNDISRSTRTSTLAHRTEVLDDHMNYSNWNKMVNIVSSIVTKFNKSVVGLVDSKEYFDRLNHSALPDHIEEWTRDIRRAEKEREKGDLERMDIMAPVQTGNDEGMCLILLCCFYCDCWCPRRSECRRKVLVVGVSSAGMLEADDHHP